MAGLFLGSGHVGGRGSCVTAVTVRARSPPPESPPAGSVQSDAERLCYSAAGRVQQTVGHWLRAQVSSQILVPELTSALWVAHFQVPHQEDEAAQRVSENSQDVCEMLTVHTTRVLTAVETACCPPSEDGGQMCSVPRMEYYPAIKRAEVLTRLQHA